MQVQTSLQFERPSTAGNGVPDTPPPSTITKAEEAIRSVVKNVTTKTTILAQEKIRAAFAHVQKSRVPTTIPQDAQAKYNLARCYHYGERGVQKNLKNAVMLYTEAAKQGFAPALCELGTFYELGKVVGKDLKKAANYYKAAADQGDHYGQHNLGRLYLHGIGVQRNFKTAIHYHKLAAQKVTKSQCALGLCNERGLGTPRNLFVALYHYTIAFERGHQKALSAIERVKTALVSKE